jgi:hypothetical protein
VAAEADQREHAEREQAEHRRPEHSRALAPASRREYEERQRQAGRDLDSDADHERARGRAKARARAGAQHERRGERQQHQRVVVRAADGEHEQHRIEADERRRPAARLAELARRARDQRDRAEAARDGEPLERPQRAREAERRRRVAEQCEQWAIGGVLVGPAEEREDFVARRLRRYVRVRIEPVQRAETGKADVAEHVLGDQRRPEQQDRVRRDDRQSERAHRQRAGACEHEQIARAHDQHQRLEAPRAEAHVQAGHRPGQPRRPAAAARRHVLRRFPRRPGAREKDRHDDAEQPEQPECARRARALAGHLAPGRAANAAWSATTGANRRAWRGRGGLHRLIVTSSRKEAYGGKCRIPA